MLYTYSRTIVKGISYSNTPALLKHLNISKSINLDLLLLPYIVPVRVSDTYTRSTKSPIQSKFKVFMRRLSVLHLLRAPFETLGEMFINIAGFSAVNICLTFH